MLYQTPYSEYTSHLVSVDLVNTKVCPTSDANGPLPVSIHRNIGMIEPVGVTNESKEAALVR